MSEPEETVEVVEDDVEVDVDEDTVDE